MRARVLLFLVGILFALIPHSALASASTTVTSNIIADTRWTLDGSPYVVNFNSNPYSLHTLTVAPGATLTIDPGVAVKFGAYDGITVQGTLRALGTADNPIIFTSLQDDTAGGDTNGDGVITAPADEQWMHIEFNNGSSGTFNHATVRYGGASFLFAYTGIANYGGTLAIDHTTLAHNGYDGLGQYAGHTTLSNSLISDQSVGINMNGGVLDMSDTRIHDNGSGIDHSWGTLSVEHSEIDHNGTGIVAESQGSITVSNSSIHDNSSGIYNNESQISVDARNNWWGTASGPQASDVFGDVAYASWLMSDPFAPPDPCAVPGSCVSNVLFLPGIEGSRLYYRDVIGGVIGIEHQVWEPDYHTDIPYLAMNTNGTSKYQLYTKDIVDMLQTHNPYWNTIAGIFGTNNLESYSGFEHFMDELVMDGTVKEWRAYPYDWRYDVRDIVNNGTLVETSGSSVQRVYLKNVLEDMASSSPSGKVTIVAHSNGGLLAKALALSLGADASKYIDRIIMVGTPQWGTPSSIGAMLHGDGGTQGFGIITNGSDIRAAAETMPGTYGLLPSPAYFSHISDPVVTFNTGGMLSSNFATNFGAALTSFSALVNFVTDSAGLDATAGGAQDLRTPLALSSALVDKATATHTALDSWTPPAGITVTAIAGWGQDTPKALAYSTVSKVVCATGSAFTTSSGCADTPSLQHTPVTTQDGDDTVVSPSAVGNIEGSLYFDSKTFQEAKNGLIVHQNLTSAQPIQNIIASLLQNKDVNTQPYIFAIKPPNEINPITLRISSHSPVNLVVTDASGNQSGVLPMPGTDFSGIKRDILGSSVQVVDDEQYINVPQSGIYQIVASGYAPGSATLAVDTLGSDGTVTASTTFSNIPTTASSTVSFSVAGGVTAAPAVDMTGDGITDFTVASSSTGADPLAYVHYMRTAIKALTLSKETKHELDERLGEIEKQLTPKEKESDDKKVNKDKEKKDKEKEKKDNNDRILHQLAALETSAGRQKGISITAAEIILGMINQLKALL